jgi:spermidine synthase
VTICDLDPTVGEVSRRFFPEVSAGAFADSRLRVVARDGRAFLAESEETWDGIIVDLTDPSGPCRLLYTREFYDLARQRLAPQGFLVTNADTPDVGGLFAEVVATLRCAFPVVHAYLAFVPSFFVRQGFALAFAEAPPVLPEAGARAARFATTMAARGLETRAFDSVDLARFFELTLAVRTLLSRAVAISTDERPLEIAQAGAEAFERDGP